MTIFYCFPSNQGFASEFIKDGISISVIGDYYASEPEWTEENPKPEDYEAEYKGYLVNAVAEVEGWEEYKCNPLSPMRIFG